MNKYLDDFMKTFPYEGLTYDDVTLVTQYADFLPDDASLETKLTSRTTMKEVRIAPHLIYYISTVLPM